MVFDYHGYALGPGGDNFPDGRNFIQRGHGRTVKASTDYGQTFKI